MGQGAREGTERSEASTAASSVGQIITTKGSCSAGSQRKAGTTRSVWAGEGWGVVSIKGPCDIPSLPQAGSHALTHAQRRVRLPQWASGLHPTWL